MPRKLDGGEGNCGMLLLLEEVVTESECARRRLARGWRAMLRVALLLANRQGEGGRQTKVDARIYSAAKTCI